MGSGKRRAGRARSGRHGRDGARARGSFARLYDEHVWRIYGFFGYRLSSRADVEDLTQLTFERALRAWGRFDPARASALTWLMAIARNLLIDHYRTAGPIAVEDVEPLLDREHHHGPQADLGISPELESALRTLSDRDRDVIALRFGADLSGPEIAALTGLSVGNVHQILSRSLRRLRTELEPGAPSGLGGGGAV